MASILDPNQPTATSSPGLGDDEFRALKLYLIDTFGLPAAPNQLLAPIGSTSTAGIFTFTKGLIFPDQGANPSTTGQLQRNGNRLFFFDGINAQNIGQVSDFFVFKDVSEPSVTNTAVEAPLYTEGVSANTLGLTTIMHGSLDFIITNMITAATCTLKLYYGSQLFMTETITNGSGAPFAGLTGTIDFRIRSRNSTGAQGTSYTIRIDPANAAINFGSSGIFNKTHVSVIAADATVGQNFQANVLWNTASASNVISGFGIDAWKL